MLYSVIDKIMDSQDTTVGGGAASAVSGAMAAGLAGMVARLSIGKNYGLSDEEYKNIADALDSLSHVLKNGAVDDMDAYLGIKAAFALPKATEEEKNIRRAEIEKAAVTAATVPLENGQAASGILEICKKMEGRYNLAAFSDMQAAIMLAKMAVIDTALNIEANLSLIKTPEKNAEFALAASKLKDSVNNW